MGLVPSLTPLPPPDRPGLHPPGDAVRSGVLPKEEPASLEAGHAGLSDRAGPASRRRHQTRGTGARPERAAGSGGRERHARVTGMVTSQAPPTIRVPRV